MPIKSVHYFIEDLLWKYCSHCNDENWFVLYSRRNSIERVDYNARREREKGRERKGMH